MPTYQYHCDECNQPFEARRRFSDGPLTTCPEGHEGAVRRIFEPAGIIFKGSGWYIKDSKGSATTSGGASGGAKESSAKSDSGGSSSGKGE